MVEPILAGYIGCILLILFLMFGVPIFVSLGFAGIIGLFLIDGVSGAFLGSAGAAFEEVYGYSLLAIPMFIFMGNIVVGIGIGSDLYDTTYKWVGRMQGGLAVASTGFCALFGFMCGSALAGAATVGSMALSEMEKRGYNKRLSLGTLAFAGSLAVLIPPSVIMILYSALSLASLGAIFLAGISPGIILTLFIIAFVFIRCKINPNLGPKGTTSFLIKDKLKSTLHLIPVVVLFLSVIGGIYKGIWTPTEAGATACAVTLIIGLVYRRVSWATVIDAALQTAKTSIMIYMLMMGATVLSSLFFVSGLADVIANALVGLPFPKEVVVIIILFIMMIMGMFMDVLALLLISVPISLPIILKLGYDPVWWGILVIVSSETCLVTPPVGLNLFVIKGIAPEGTTLTDVAMGAAPFIGVIWGFNFLLIFFPDIAMWLPHVLM